MFLLAGLTLEALERIGRVIWPIFVPLLISLGLAYILEPVVGWFERAGLSRKRAIVATLVSSTLLLVLFIVFVVPRLAAQFAESANRLPSLVQWALGEIQPALGALRRVNEGLYQAANARITRYVADPSLLTEPAIEWLRYGVGGVTGLTTSLFESVLIPFFVYYILRDLPKMRANVELLIPPRYRTTVHELFERIASVGSNFIRGQLTVCATMATLDAVGFVGLGVPMPLFLGALAGFSHLIPYIGPFIAATLTIALTALDGPHWWQILGVIGVFVVVQTLESVVLTPLILGSRLEMHPFWVLTGITIAGNLFGILGMILATPAIAIAKVILGYAHHAYLHSSFYQGPTPVLKPPARSEYDEAAQLVGNTDIPANAAGPG